MNCLDPRPFTMRRLKILADAKREYQYDLAITHACYIQQVLNGKFDPSNSNPIANERTRQLQESISDGRGKEAFALLGAGLALVARSVPYGNG